MIDIGYLFDSALLDIIKKYDENKQKEQSVMTKEEAIKKLWCPGTEYEWAMARNDC